MNSKPNISGAGLAIGLGLLVIGAVIGFDAMRMQVPPNYARVGPQIFPYLIAMAMAATGLATCWQAWRGGDEVPREDDASPTDWVSVGIIAVALVVHMNLLKPLGFVPAGVLIFWAVAFAFGSRRYLRDGITGLALSLFAYIGFSYGLGLQLPPGVLKGLL